MGYYEPEDMSGGPDSKIFRACDHLDDVLEFLKVQLKSLTAVYGAGNFDRDKLHKISDGIASLEAAIKAIRKGK
ncbi:hypothetical protein HOL21_01095 [Candidatus Woesearchaeota archaeon]|jgi:hypothetical protein|nr:hypothetical protein [Candidatus Woesearchaeota archaeon]MBT5396790.1 hypothetical protein [Candidatus Woesearchaeota archaeon]MBT5924672.1 hypothetical protein [Candidatus Woesearchaeota archaeon]MBT6367678.1 hypothetical protein [Candidatus Woesearchaeota archaeon]MBT7762921.1 hypothetical protein [Candidatus Woesearchaeota archaeon]